ncbi:MAG: DUF2332 family protein [Janthinobacterium lividum]
MPTDETARLGVLYPAVAEAAHRAGGKAIGLVDLRPGAGPDLQLDRVGITYSNGQRLGDPTSGDQVSVRIVGDRLVPTRALPEVVTRVAIDPGGLLLPDALAEVPADVLPVVVTCWTLSRLTPEGRLRLLQRLDAAAARRPVAWVSVEGVGVAPGVPTLGDRPASGHSIVGVTVLRHASLHAEAVGRCWSRGRQLAWLAPDGTGS